MLSKQIYDVTQVSKFGRSFDQPSTPQVWKLRPNFDQTSVEV